MRKLTSLLLASTLAFGAASVVHAEADNLTPPPAGTEKPMHKPMRHGMDMMFGGLNLTADQKTKMHEIMKERRGEMQRPSLDERRATHAIIASDSFDKAQAEAQADKMTANAKANAVAMMETQNKLYNVLTPEQKKQYNANFEKHLTEKRPMHGKLAPAPAPAPAPAQ